MATVLPLLIDRLLPVMDSVCVTFGEVLVITDPLVMLIPVLAVKAVSVPVGKMMVLPEDMLKLCPLTLNLICNAAIYFRLQWNVAECCGHLRGA